MRVVQTTEGKKKSLVIRNFCGALGDVILQKERKNATLHKPAKNFISH